MQNFSIIYDLNEFWETGADGQYEVTFLQNIGQFCDPDTFVNTGHTIAVSYDQTDEDEAKYNFKE